MRHEYSTLAFLIQPKSARNLEGRVVSAMRARFDWKAFLRLADAHGVAPFVLSQLRRHELLDLVPADALAQLRAAYEYGAHRNALLREDMEPIARALDNAGVAWAPRAETALVVAGIYPDPGLRPLATLQIELAPADLRVTRTALRSVGYRYLDDERAELFVNHRGTIVQLAVADVAGPLDWRAPAHLRDKRLLARLRAHFAERDETYLLRWLIDTWFLNLALAAAGERPVPRNVTPFGLRRAVRTEPQLEQGLRPRVERRLRGLFPEREEMIRRHGKNAAGFRLYALYADRLFRFRVTPPATPAAKHST